MSSYVKNNGAIIGSFLSRSRLTLCIFPLRPPVIMINIFFSDCCSIFFFSLFQNDFHRWSVVAAIDIGDAYSRWAYAPLNDLGKQSTLRQW